MQRERGGREGENKWKKWKEPSCALFLRLKMNQDANPSELVFFSCSLFLSPSASTILFSNHLTEKSKAIWEHINSNHFTKAWRKREKPQIFCIMKYVFFFGWCWVLFSIRLFFPSSSSFLRHCVPRFDRHWKKITHGKVINETTTTTTASSPPSIQMANAKYAIQCFFFLYRALFSGMLEKCE